MSTISSRIAIKFDVLSLKGVKECHLCAGIHNKTSSLSGCTPSERIQRYFFNATALIKSKTEQRNHHWHLVNDSLYHLFTPIHNQPWLRIKRKKKSPSRSESMIGISELCLKRTLTTQRRRSHRSCSLPSLTTNQSFSVSLKHHRKDQKKVDKLTAQIPYHEGRGNKEEVEKIKAQVDAIWQKTREAAFA